MNLSKVIYFTTWLAAAGHVSPNLSSISATLGSGALVHPFLRPDCITRSSDLKGNRRGFQRNEKKERKKKKLQL